MPYNKWALETRTQYDIAASVVAYNTDPAELTALLHALQRGPLRVRVTVVDNSATADLRAVVESAGAVYLHPVHNVGFGAGHNLALRESMPLAKYQVMVNPDIRLSETTLEDLFEFMETHPEVGQVMPQVLYDDGTEQRLTKRLPTPLDLFVRRFLGPVGKRLAPRMWGRYELRDIDLSATRDVPSLSGCFMFVRTAVLGQVGLFDERYFLYMEDVDLCRRIGSVSRTVFFPPAQLRHGYDKGSYKNRRLAVLHLRSAVQYFNKWGWFFDSERRRRNRLR